MGRRIKSIDIADTFGFSQIFKDSWDKLPKDKKTKELVYIRNRVLTYRTFPNVSTFKILLKELNLDFNKIFKIKVDKNKSYSNSKDMVDALIKIKADLLIRNPELVKLINDYFKNNNIDYRITQSMIGKWLNRNNNMSAISVVLIAKVFGIDINQLYC